MPGDQSRKNGKLGGRRPGSLGQGTLDKIAARELLRSIIMERLGPMTRAQMAAAEGISYAVMRREDGTYVRVATEAALDEAIAAGGARMQVFTSAPSTAAFTDLMNRTLDMPARQIELTGNEDKPVVIRWLSDVE